MTLRNIQHDDEKLSVFFCPLIRKNNTTLAIWWEKSTVAPQQHHTPALYLDRSGVVNEAEIFTPRPNCYWSSFFYNALFLIPHWCLALLPHVGSLDSFLQPSDSRGMQQGLGGRHKKRKRKQHTMNSTQVTPNTYAETIWLKRPLFVWLVSYGITFQ